MAFFRRIALGISFVATAACGGPDRDAIVGIWQGRTERIEFLPAGTVMTNIQMATSGTWTAASGDGRYAVTLNVPMGGPVSLPACLQGDTLAIRVPKGLGYLARVRSDGSVATPDLSVTCN
jgi:hypothetical protein